MTTPSSPLIEAAHRTQRWIRKRPMLIDIGVVVLVAILAGAENLDADRQGIGSRDADLLVYVLVGAAALALFWRRSQPILVLASVVTIICVSYILGYTSYHSPLGFVAFYSVAAHGENRRRVWITVAVALLVLFAIASFTLLGRPAGYRYGDAASLLVWCSATAAGGAMVRNRHAIFLGTEARADRAEADRTAAAERAVANERLRIAREMHDVVTHGMGVITVQAAAARETLEIRPDQARDLLLSIESTGRESLMEMRRMLGVLRNGDDQHPNPETKLSPQPSLDDLDRLVANSVEAGTPTELVVSGTPTPLSPGVELAAFRIVQEALTNVRKHAGATATARVELRYSPNEIHLTITDTGRESAAKPQTTGSGNGLVGMRERVDVYGGELTAGPRPGGGYQIAVQLPNTPHQNRHHVETKQPNITSPK